MSDEKKKEGSFVPECITDLQDKLLSHHYALRAFAVLLQDSDLTDFATRYPTPGYEERNHEAQALRLGLSQIIELYLEHQERIIEKHVEQYEQLAGKAKEGG